MKVLDPPNSAHRRIACIAISLIAFAWLLLAPLARADYDPLASGTTKLTLDKGFLALLKQNGVTVSALAPATLKGTAVTFPVVGGKFDPVAAKGTVEHEGALLFRAGNRKVPLKSLKLRTTQKSSPFSAKVGGSQLKIATVKSVSVARQGFGDRVGVTNLALSAKLATRLAKKLDRRGVFKAGSPIGSTATSAQPETVTLLGKEDATLTLAPGFVAKLESLFVAVNPIFPAEHPAGFTLPIFGGQLAPDGVGGRLETKGALEFLQLGGGQVFWAEGSFDLDSHTYSPELNVQPSPPYLGKAGPTPVAELTAGIFVANPATRSLSVSEASLTLGAAIAQTFNEVFARPQGKDGVFLPGEALGTLAFTAQGQ